MPYEPRFSPEFREHVIRLKRRGASWAAINRETLVSISQARRWVHQRDREEGVVTPAPTPTQLGGFLAGYNPNRPSWILAQWYEARLQQNSAKIEAAANREAVAKLTAAGNMIWKAFRVFLARVRETGEDDNGYREHLNRLVEQQERRLRQAKQAQKEAAFEVKAERIEENEP
jgi:transposase-like protein